MNGTEDPVALEEETRLKILEARRKQIRTALKSAEALRYFRLKNNIGIPELDENGKPQKSNGKLALGLTAFVVAAGAVALRVGGRAALISAVGLDFVTDNADLKANMDQIVSAAEAMALPNKLALFTAGWIAVKVLCFDAGGVALALASGILFGGVWQGAVVSAAAATVGSLVALSMAKLETPIRKKALELLEEYPSLRGIEKVVAEDGLKAVLTLRLAPILPIPLGMYNYIYGVTNVPIFDFAAGIFLGSLKPYLLDSYLGYFGKSIIDGSIDSSGMQDIILLVVLGVSVLIGVFASQLATEMWESVLEETEAEKKAKLASGDAVEGKDDRVTRSLMGWNLPDWIVGFQLSMKSADQRVKDLIASELEAQVWNFTSTIPVDGAVGGVPPDLDPAKLPGSPEIKGAYKGIDLVEALCDGLVLGPVMMQIYGAVSDPFYSREEDLLLNSRLPTLGRDVDAKELLLKEVESLKLLQQRLKRLEERVRGSEYKI